MTRVSHAGIREALAACGPLTGRELGAFFQESSQQDVSAMISSMRRLAKKQVYVFRYERHATDSTRDYLRAVYALGDKPDARKPRPMSNAERCKRHKVRKALPRVPNSVFALAAYL